MVHKFLKACEQGIKNTKFYAFMLLVESGMSVSMSHFNEMQGSEFQEPRMSLP